MGTGYSDLSSDDYRPSPEWYETAEAKRLLAEGCAHTLSALANDFEKPDAANVLHEHQLRERAGQTIISAFSRGLLRGIPNLAKFVEWHTASNENDPIVGKGGIEARRARCASNLFLDVIGGHMAICKLEGNGTINIVGPKLDDGILPAIDPMLFARGDAAAACRFLARTIEAEATAGNVEKTTAVAAPSKKWVKPSMYVDARKLSATIRTVPREVVSSFKESDPQIRKRKLSDITGEIMFDAFELITWIERNHPGSADLEKSRLFSLQDQAITCAAMDIPEYAGGKVNEQSTPGPISDGASLTAALMVFCEVFARAVRGWADEIEDAGNHRNSSSDGRWSKPDSPTRWAKAFDISRDTLLRRFKDGKIRNQKLSSKSYRIHVDDLPRGQK